MRLLRFLRCLLGRIFYKLAYLFHPEARVSQKVQSVFVSEDAYDIIPKGQYQYIPADGYVYGPADRFLLVPKNRYKLVLLPDQKISSDMGVGWITENNTPEGYDLLWGDSTNLEAFRSEADHTRDRLTVEIVDHIVPFIKLNSSVIDIGCGVGDLLLEVQKRKPDAKVYGLDFSCKAIEGAKKQLPDGEFMQYVLSQTLPYETAAFDIVLCTDVLEHLDYPKTMVSEMVRICRPGGLVAIVVPDGDVDQFFGHYWFWNEESLRTMLSDWNAEVDRLPQTKEFLAKIFVE